MVQNLVVAVVVLASTIYAVWALMPAPLQRSAAAGVASLARRFGLGASQTERLQSKLATHGGCGQCDSCKGCASAQGQLKDR